MDDIHPLQPCQSTRSPSHLAAWLVASHAPPGCCRSARGALFPRCQGHVCRARWTIRCRQRLTPNSGSSNSGELCVVPLCSGFRVFVREFSVCGWEAPTLLSVEHFGVCSPKFLHRCGNVRRTLCRDAPSEGKKCACLADNVAGRFLDMCGVGV